MKSPLAVKTRFSGFRFSLKSLRSPTSASPRTPKTAENKSIDSISSSPTVRDSPDLNEKEDVRVTVVDDETVNALRSPTALPSPRTSPLTPWHATFHRNAASVEQETTYLKRTTQLRYAQLALSGLLFATAVAVVGVESDIVARYNRTHLAAEWHLSLWPTDLNVKPTLLLLITGAITTFLALITSIVAVIPSPNPRTQLNNRLFTVLCILATPLSLASLILSAVISPAAIFSTFVSNTITSLVTTTGPSNTIGLTPNGNAQRETIQSFTCAISNTAKAFNSDASVLRLPTVSDSHTLVPSGFSQICRESNAGLAIMIVILILAVVGLAVSAWSWTVERQIERLRGEREVIASRTGSRDFKVDGTDIPESLVGKREESAV